MGTCPAWFSAFLLLKRTDISKSRRGKFTRTLCIVLYSACFKYGSLAEIQRTILAGISICSAFVCFSKTSNRVINTLCKIIQNISIKLKYNFIVQALTGPCVTYASGPAPFSLLGLRHPCLPSLSHTCPLSFPLSLSCMHPLSPQLMLAFSLSLPLSNAYPPPAHPLFRAVPSSGAAAAADLLPCPFAQPVSVAHSIPIPASPSPCTCSVANIPKPIIYR